METYRLSWIPSESTFVQTQRVFATINGGAEVQVGADLLSNVAFIDAQFATDANVSWFVRTIGDNDSVKDSVPDVFVAENQEKVVAATGLAHLFVSHSE